MDGAEVVDLVVFIFCIAVLVAYHLWYFFRGRWGKPNKWQVGRRRRRHYVDMWSTSVKSRGLWAVAMMADPKEGVLAVQTWRNVIIASTLLVTAQAQIASRLIQILTTTAQLQKVASYSQADPLTGSNPLADPELKIALALGALFLSLLTFAQCARLAVHLGFLTRVVPEHPRTSLPIRDEVIAMTRRASLYFTIGLRFFYLFIPLIMWLLGTLALLVTTLVLLAALISMDQVPVDDSFSRFARKLYQEESKHQQLETIEEEGGAGESGEPVEGGAASSLDMAECGLCHPGRGPEEGDAKDHAPPVLALGPHHRQGATDSGGIGERLAEGGDGSRGRRGRRNSFAPQPLPRVPPLCLMASEATHGRVDLPR